MGQMNRSDSSTNTVHALRQATNSSSRPLALWLWSDPTSDLLWVVLGGSWGSKVAQLIVSWVVIIMSQFK